MCNVSFIHLGLIIVHFFVYVEIRLSSQSVGSQKHPVAKSWSVIMSSSGRSSPQSPSTRRLSSNRRRKGKKKKKAKLKLPKIDTEDEKMLAQCKKFWYDSLTSKPSKEEMFQIPGYSFDSARKSY